MVLLDTSALVDSLSGVRRSWSVLDRVFRAGERVRLPAWVLYEWRRGPRTDAELAVQQALFPDEQAIAFTAADAACSARLYRTLPRARNRVADFAVAACALRYHAVLWTLNRADFADIPELRLADPDDF